MRLLSSIEIEQVAGCEGDGDGSGDVVVTGYRYGFSYGGWGGGSDSGGYSPYPTLGDGDGSGGGGSSGNSYQYASLGVSAAANGFADAHMSYEGSSAFPIDHKVYEHDHDKLAVLYDKLDKHPDSIISLGDGKSITARQALNDIANVVIHITDAPLENTYNQDVPAYTKIEVDGTIGIYINPGQQVSQNYEGENPDHYAYKQDSGTDYEPFHEIGHEIQALESYSIFNASNIFTESQANSIGRSLELNAGITLLSDQSGALIDPTNGYYNE